MSFISYEQREDFQEDTFKLIAALVIEAIKGQVSKDIEALFSSIDAIYTVLHKRVKNTEEFSKKLEVLRKEIYTRTDVSDYDKSKQFDKARELWKELAGALDDAGLILRERLDKGELVTRM